MDGFRLALERAYPPGFRDDLDRLRAGDAVAVEAALAFLEADPMFFRSGYTKAKLLHLLKRVPLTVAEVGRLRAVILRVVGLRGGQEFGRNRRLAPKLDGPEFRAELGRLLDDPRPSVRDRAGLLLDALRRAEGAAADGR